jgi:hypothetical protein
MKHLRNIKQWSIISLFSILILLLTGCATNVDTVLIHFTPENIQSNENMYIRYEDGSTEQVDKGTLDVTDSTYKYSVSTNPTKNIIGYFVTDGVYSWIPSINQYNSEAPFITPTLNSNGHNSFEIKVTSDENPHQVAAYAKVGIISGSIDESMGESASVSSNPLGQIVLYDADDNIISEGVDLFVKTSNVHLYFKVPDGSSPDSYHELKSYSGGSPITYIYSDTDNINYTLSQLKLTAASGMITIPVYPADYVRQLDLNHDGINDIQDVVLFSNHPFDVNNDGFVDKNDIQFMLSQINSQIVPQIISNVT